MGLVVHVLHLLSQEGCPMTDPLPSHCNIRVREHLRPQPAYRYFWSFLEKLCSKPESGIPVITRSQAGSSSAGHNEAAQSRRHARFTSTGSCIGTITWTSCRPSPALQVVNRVVEAALKQPARTSRFTVLYCTALLSFLFLQHSQEQDRIHGSEGWGAPDRERERERERLDINTDGRPLPTKRRWRTSSKACDPHRLHACAPRSTSS